MMQIRPKPVFLSYPTLEAYIEDLVDWKFEQRAAIDREWLRDLGVDPESE